MIEKMNAARRAAAAHGDARQNVQSKFWMVTLNNPEGILDPSLWPRCEEAVWQLEIADTGTVHYQMYIQFTSNMRLNALKSLPGLRRISAQVRRGTKTQAVNYVTKTETRLEGPFWYPDRETVMTSGNWWYRGGIGFRLHTLLDDSAVGIPQ